MDCEDNLMLVLTRRAGESIMIDNEIELKVLKIRGSQVHLGIDAPKKSAVHRKEVWLRIHGEPNSAPPHPEHDDDLPNDNVKTA
jgi:carbon storage regulator